jgi:hypothetical protein
VIAFVAKKHSISSQILSHDWRDSHATRSSLMPSVTIHNKLLNQSATLLESACMLITGHVAQPSCNPAQQSFQLMVLPSSPPPMNMMQFSKQFEFTSR